MRKKILITGASGFAGRSLSNYLTKKKFKITNIVYKNNNLNKGKKINLTKKINLKYSFDWVIHTAAYHKIRDFKNNSKAKSKKNILMVKNLINFSKARKIKNFIFFSTIDINYFPYTKIKDVYIKSKVFCEKILFSALKKNIFDKVIVLRLPAIVGKNSNENFIKITLKKLKKNEPVYIWNKNQYFNNLIHINDLNNLINHFIVKKNNSKKIIVDCLSSQPIKLLNLIYFLKKKLKSKSKINFINKKNEYKKIKFNKKIKYRFFSLTKVMNLLI